MAAPSVRQIAKWIAMTVSMGWVCAMIYTQFLTIDPDEYGFLAPDVQQQMDNCGGSFQQRYDCKEAIIIAKGHKSFLIWMGKVALILGPPMGLAAIASFATRRRINDMPNTFEPPPVPIARHRVR